MKKRILVILLAFVAIFGVTACGDKNNQEEAAEPGKAGKAGRTEGPGEAEEPEEPEETEIQVFVADSLNNVMEEIVGIYQESHPGVNVACNADSQGTLLAQIEEGHECDVFFPASGKQMDQLEEAGMVVEGTRSNAVKNQVVVVSGKGGSTAVKGLENLGEASSIALAGGSVPVGWYTRQALMNLGILEKADDPSAVGTGRVSEALGGVEISEQANVDEVLLAVVEGFCEVGTVYYSDTCGHEDDLDILQTVSYDLSGDVVYPIAQVVNQEADEAQTAAAKDFIAFILSDAAKEIFEKYYFDTNVE